MIEFNNKFILESSFDKHPEQPLSEQPQSSSQVALTFSPGQDIDNAFIRLSVTIKRMIESTRFSDLRGACLEKATSPKSFMSSNVVHKIEEAKTFDTLYTMLTKSQYWNFLDTRMMEAMVNASMIPAAHESLENFKKAFFDMKLSEVVPDFVPVIPLKPGHTTMEETLDKNPKQLTIFELHKHRFYLETELLETGTDTLGYRKIRVGSVIITWQIHVAHVYQAYLSLNKKRSQLPSYGITSLSIPIMSMWEGLSFLWRGQEVDQIGPIEASVDHVRQEPHPLPYGLQWTNLNSENVNEIVALKGHGSDAEDLRRHLQWLMSHPLFDANFLFGVRMLYNNELVSVAYSTPCHINVGGRQIRMIQLRYIGVEHGQSTQLYNAVIKEIMRRANLIGIYQATIDQFSPMIVKPVAIFNGWYCFSQFASLTYNSPRTSGLRKMKPADVPKAFALTNQYVSQFEIGQFFKSKNEFSHYFLYQGQRMAYVVEDPITHKITDMFVFKLQAAMALVGVIAIIASKTPARQLLTDLLICAKQENFAMVSTHQFGLGEENFKNLFEPVNQYEYWHIYNYRYNEVTEESCCVFTDI